MEEKDVELIDYLNLLWKRKWLILVGTLLCMIAVGIVGFTIKPVYEIDTIVQPGKFIVENQAGNFEEIVVETPQQIADKVKHNSYNALIALKMDLDVSRIPVLKAENIRSTLLTRIWARSSEVPLSRDVLAALVEFIKSDIDNKVDIEINNVDSEIRANEIDRERRTNEIKILEKKLQIVSERKKDLLKEMEKVKGRIDTLEEEQLTVLKKENKTQEEGLNLLLYSTEILQSYRNYDELNEKFADERLKEEDINSSLQLEHANIEKIDTTIANLKERKGRFDHTKIIKLPTSSLNPVFPKKKIMVLAAGFFGLIIFVILAVFLEYIRKKNTALET